MTLADAFDSAAAMVAISAPHSAKNRRDAGQHRQPAEWRETAMRREIAKSGTAAGDQAEHIRRGDQDERDDRGNLDGREPELELTEGARRGEIHDGERDEQAETHLPLGNVDPAVQQLRAGNRLDRDHHDPEIPVQPAAQEPGPVPEAEPRIFGERAYVGIRRHHLGKHPHDEEHHEARKHVAHDHGGPDRCDGRAAADEEAGADDPAERDHGDVPRAQPALQATAFGVERNAAHRFTAALARS